MVPSQTMAKVESPPTKPHSVWAEARRSIMLMSGVALVLLICFSCFIYNMPDLKEHELEILKGFPPRKLQDVVAIRDVLLNYAGTYPVFMALGFCLLYITMQTFAVPGTLFLSLLSGAVFGVRNGVLLVAVVSTLGSSACYGLSRVCGKALAHAIWPDRLDKFGAEVKRRKQELLAYIIFLRVTPLLPNTFINIASPIVDVPFKPFLIGTFVGCLPNNFVAVNAGMRLGDIQSLSELYDVRMMLIGFVVALIAILPVFFARWHERKQPAKKT